MSFGCDGDTMNPILLPSFLDQLNTLLHSEDRTLETTQRVFYAYISCIDSCRELPKAEIAEILKTFSPHLPEFRRTSQNVEMELERLYAQSILAKRSTLTGYLTERFEKIVAAELALFERFLGVQESRRILCLWRRAGSHLPCSYGGQRWQCPGNSYRPGCRIM